MTATPLRIVFAGTPPFAAAHLGYLLQTGHTVVSAYSQPDRPSGRGKKLQATPVKALAEAHGIPVQQPLKFDPEALASLAAQAPDLMVVVAYGLLLPQTVLALPRLGCINVHASLLPRWRGAAPIERALLAGDHETGVSIMQMDAGLDTGPVLGKAVTPITPDDNSETLTARLQTLGCQALGVALAQLATGTAYATPQADALACYARKLGKAEAAIDWHADASFIHRQVRAFFPRSPAWCLYRGQRLRIVAASVCETAVHAFPGTIIAANTTSVVIACGKGALEVHQVQLEGRNPMTLDVLRNGHPDLLQQGHVLETPPPHAPAH